LAGEIERDTDPLPAAQALVSLLVKVGQLDDAIGVASQYLATIPEGASGCPGIAELCLRAGQPERLAQIAREQGDLVKFTAALVQSITK
jgi:hypothetical protein